MTATRFRRRHGLAPPALVVCAALVVFLAMPAAEAGAATPPPVTSSATAEATIYGVQFADCAARLTRAKSEPLLTYDNPCHQELETKVSTLVRMVELALPERMDREEGAMLHVASLEKTFPDFAKRLAQAAARSPEWYGERAKRDPGFGNPLVVKIANTTPVYRELQEALRSLDLRVQLVDVDKLQVALPAETPFGFWLADRGVNARKQVPYDAEVWFRVVQ